MGTLVETTAGRVEGFERDGVCAFRGVAFARPPVGALRFRAPEPPEPWGGVRPARERAASAPQNPGVITRMLADPNDRQAEDCLYLNLWTPAADAGRRPVMVWIHGGGFTIGSGSHPAYAGARLARAGDVVVVTLNYRLGALGFLCLESGEEPEAGGNLGLLDQVAALEWVRDNVAAFGGDPDNVTLFGASAGAMSAGTLLGVRRARRLFHRAILQSGAAHNVHDREEARLVAHRFAAELGVAPDDVPALRAAPVESLLAAQDRCSARLAGRLHGLVFQPFVDGELLTQPPLDRIRADVEPTPPLLIGTNLDEWKLFGLADPDAAALDASGLRRRCAQAFGEGAAQRVIDAYVEARAGRASLDPGELWFAIATDRWFRRPATELAELCARRQGRSYAYLFTWPSPALGGKLGACHALEVPFVFGTTDVEPLPGLVGDGPEARALAASVQAAWLRFARDGDPGGAGLGDWPAYEPGSRATMQLGPAAGVIHAPLEAERRVWDEVR